MFYYQFNMGDYRRDTGHLTLLEHGIYRQLIDLYYITEKPLDANAMRLVCVRTTEEEQAYKTVLADFFQERDGKYIHKRCEFEISKYKDKSSKATDSAKTRWDYANAMRTHPFLDANGMPTKEPKNLTTGKPNKTNKLYNPPGTSKTIVAKRDCHRPETVSEQVWDDFQTLRRAKKAPLTSSALNRIDKEAGKAGILLEAALIECCARGWTGFKAEWMKGKADPLNFTAANRRLLEKIETEERLLIVKPLELGF